MTCLSKEFWARHKAKCQVCKKIICEREFWVLQPNKKTVACESCDSELRPKSKRGYLCRSIINESSYHPRKREYQLHQLGLLEYQMEYHWKK